MTYSNRALEIVLKISGKCNINCQYCYMFNKGNVDYLKHPAYIKNTTINNVVNFIEKGIDDCGIDSVFVIFHGGEPLMIKADRFDEICSLLQRKLKQKLRLLMFSIQTNAMLVTDEWIKVLSNHNVSIGISLDGPEKYHDQVRVDHRGNGSYRRSIDGLEKINAGVEKGLLKPPGVLCVVNPEHSGKEIYRHFVDNLGFTWMNFLLPMETHDTIPEDWDEKAGNYLLGVFDEWVNDDNTAINIRIFSHFLKFITKPELFLESSVKFKKNIIVPIATNGDVSVDDETKPINFGQELGNVSSYTLQEHIASEEYLHVQNLMQNCPPECENCEWAGFCRGGAQNQLALNRYSAANGFNNKSVFCNTYKRLYAKMAEYLLKRGLSEERLADVLLAAYEEIRFVNIPMPRSVGEIRQAEFIPIFQSK